MALCRVQTLVLDQLQGGSLAVVAALPQIGFANRVVRTANSRGDARLEVAFRVLPRGMKCAGWYAVVRFAARPAQMRKRRTCLRWRKPIAQYRLQTFGRRACGRACP